MSIRIIENRIGIRYVVNCWTPPPKRKVKRVVKTLEEAQEIERKIKAGEIQPKHQSTGRPRSPKVPAALLKPYWESFKETRVFDSKDWSKFSSIWWQIIRGEGEVGVVAADSFLSQIDRTEVWFTDPELNRYYA